MEVPVETAPVETAPAVEVASATWDESMNRNQLLAVAKSLGVKVSPTASKVSIIEALKSASGSNE